MSTVRLFSSIALSFVLLFGYGFVTTSTAEAQSGLLGGKPSLQVRPSTPAPHSEVTLSLNAYTMSTNNVTIRWYVDGTEQQESRNDRSITVTMDGLGTSKRVRVDVSGEVSFSLSRTLTPATIDLVIEAYTTVPVFYKGRPLPTPESLVRVVAVPHLSSNIDLDALSYKWEFDGTVLSGGSIKGRQAESFRVPMVGNPMLSVTIFDPTGAVVAEKSLFLSTVRPELYFYKENPLRSTHRRAIGETTTLVGDEMTVRAEPYFMNTDLFSSNWKYGWKLNNTEVSSAHNDPRLITFRPTGGRGTAHVGFSLTNRRGLLQTADASFEMTFDSTETNERR